MDKQKHVCETLKNIYEFALAEAKLTTKTEEERHITDEGHALTLILGCLVGSIINTSKDKSMEIYEMLINEGRSQIQQYFKDNERRGAV
jgi:hypothetical protein